MTEHPQRTDRAPATAPSELVAAVIDAFEAVLGQSGIGPDDHFFELGGSSVLVNRAVEHLRRRGHARVGVAAFFGAPTPRGIARLLAGDEAVTEESAPALPAADATAAGDHHAGAAIAIIGVAGRFPGAADVEGFWANLLAGRDTVRRFTPEEIDPQVPHAQARDPAYVRARGVLDDVESFDAAFFGMNPREAEIIDPQQRVFLEICWECLERAGHARLPGQDIGVFGGVYSPTYLVKNVFPHAELRERHGEFHLMVANDKDYVTTRVAHRLDLTGPAVSVHTACSTSLVAVAQAMDALRAGRCRMALAGGASITVPMNSGHVHEEGGMLSGDGATRTFDAGGQGTVFSDGAAVVLLKRLDDALADGDHVHAVLLGAATNNDGGGKASFTAPSVEGQEAVIRAAQRDAGVRADSIGYVEAHGTATPLGDPIEVEALSRAFRRDGVRPGACLIGSVKTNVGHLVTAAGTAGLIKTALALEHGRLPASLHYREPNPRMDLAASPFRVVQRPLLWPRGTAPRRAGVSSFGVGGTNAHVVLEEAPTAERTPMVPGTRLLRLSARSRDALGTALTRLADHLDAHPHLRLDDVAHTLDVGRRRFAWRAAVAVDGIGAAAAALRGGDATGLVSGQAAPSTPQAVFVFPGQGSQYAGMGRGLHAADPAFRAAFDECIEALGPDDGPRLRQRIFEGDDATLRATSVTQPALFCLEYALARALMARGIEPDLMIGHSVGEFVAAALAGIMSAGEAVRLVALRGRLMEAMPAGAMLSVRAGAADVEALLPADLDLAADNGPTTCVVAGPGPALDAFALTLEARGIATRRLQTSHAFHSRMMDAAIAPFEAAVRAVALRAPSRPIVSTLSGQPLDAATATDPGYWARHLRAPVRFSPAVRQVLALTGAKVFVELGPRATLSTLIRQHRDAGRPAPVALSTGSDDPVREAATWWQALGAAWCAGFEPVTPQADGRRVPLPTTPYDRKRCWIDPPMPTAPAADGADAAALPSDLPNTSLTSTAMNRRTDELTLQVLRMLEDVSGLDLDAADPGQSFVELGLDSLTLTQVAAQIKRTWKVGLTFRALMETHRTVAGLARHLADVLPDEAPVPTAASQPAAPARMPAPAAPIASQVAVPAAALPPGPSLPVQPLAVQAASAAVLPAGVPADGAVAQLLQQQLALMSQQLALLSGGTAVVTPAAAAAPAPVAAPAASVAPTVATSTPAPRTPSVPMPSPAADTDDVQAHTRYDVRKAFGAIARIHTQGEQLAPSVLRWLDDFSARYAARTARSKAYTREHRAHLADPRVVNGFRPQTKEVTYQIVVDRSHGARMWDIDGNEYVDALSGFGMGLFGWQPEFVQKAVEAQLRAGYEIGPQHPLAGDVARLVCELTGHDRAGLCNTGSEAVMGAVRIARTVTGRPLIVTFSNSYHGIFDEVIIRGNKRHQAVPAAPGILPENVGNVMVLEYGDPAGLALIRERADDIAAVLVEPVQSRRPELQPREFLHALREVTRETGSVLIFDEVITGFRAHLGGAQAHFGVKADLASYGKVIGGGFPIGVIAGRRDLMDALDGGAWDYGDDSMPTVGVTYFAGTFVRHPLALAATKASLEHLKAQGPALQERLNARTAAMVEAMNAHCRATGAPVLVKHFSSLWRITFTGELPLQDLLFAAMRLRGVHLLDNFPCYLTTAHGDAEIATILDAFKGAVDELVSAGVFPGAAVAPTAPTQAVQAAGPSASVEAARAIAAAAILDAARPPVPGARLGRDEQGRPAWYVATADGQSLVKVG